MAVATSMTLTRSGLDLLGAFTCSLPRTSGALMMSNAPRRRTFHFKSSTGLIPHVVLTPRGGIPRRRRYVSANLHATRGLLFLQDKDSAG